MAEKGFTHFDGGGGAVMVDVGEKEVGSRLAIACGVIEMREETLRAIQGGAAKKGDVLGVARIGGIMAAKRTAELIPLCHPLVFDACAIDFSFPKPDGPSGLRRLKAVCTVRLSGKTGAEMEALTGVSVALLTIYDMCKALDRGMVLGDIKLVEKSGGKSGRFKRDV
ncbi:MAG: cyclic pyranopterin monophosphate synthase MoaC [Spirochaetaceae bacterium]|jgi:cyclic pyranopterin phosphate synthase|nr:cyclic pyranopterin monophosphate synthase MoaC [Spirochaetaceae bacterium]